MKKILIITLLLLSILAITSCSSNDDKTVIYYFHGPGCPSCDVELDFLNSIESKYPFMEIKYYNISDSNDAELLEELAVAYDERIVTPPAIFIGEESIIGFGSKDTTGVLIEDMIENCEVNECPNPSDVLKNFEKNN